MRPTAWSPSARHLAQHLAELFVKHKVLHETCCKVDEHSTACPPSAGDLAELFEQHKVTLKIAKAYMDQAASCAAIPILA